MQLRGGLHFSAFYLYGDWKLFVYVAVCQLTDKPIEKHADSQTGETGRQTHTHM